MALNVSMTGTGSIGNITPNWSANEFATPVAISDSGAGTGTVSFSAKANDDSLLCINNNITSTVNGFGDITGVVQSVSQTGNNVSLTHGTILDKFNLDVSVPPVQTGGVPAWFYNLGKSVFGESISRPDYKIVLTDGNPFYTYWTTGQVSYSFPFDLSPTDLTDVYDIDTIFDNSLRQASGSSYGFAYSNNDYATTLAGALAAKQSDPFLPGMVNESYQNEFGNIRYGTRYFQMMLDVDASTDITIWLKVGDNADVPTYSNMVSFNIDGTADTSFVEQTSTAVTDSISLSTLDHTRPILFTFSIRGNNGVSVQALDANGVSVTSATTATVFLLDYLDGNNLYIAGDYINCTKIYYVNFALRKLSNNTNPIGTGTYITPAVIDYGFNIDFSEYTQTYNGPYPSCKGVGWELMQQLAAAESFEIAISGDVVYVRDVGLRVFDLTNYVASPTINPTSTLSGRQINIAYSDATFVNGLIYDAETDGNNIITVNAGETTVTSVKHDVHPISVDQPSLSETWPISSGQYFVIDSAGVRLLEDEWYGYGGSVNVEIDPNDPAAIRITVIGPYTDVTLAGGPYELAASDGGNKYASLKIAGTGVYSGDGVLGLLTGVDSSKYTRATVNSISNPFIVTKENAYDRGLFAAQKASGPVVTFSGSIPASSIDGIGLTCGSLFTFMNSTYRITSCSINGISASISAERYVTVADVDAIWGSQTVEDYDNFWGNYESQDQIIFPYKVA